MKSANDHARSYYAATAHAMPAHPSLGEDLDVDVCVIGGGFTGINTAIELAQRGLSVVVLEARRIGWGASGRNGGQLIRGIGHDVSGFARYVGEEGVRYLQQAGTDSVALVGERIRTHQIDCDLRWGFCELANTASQFATMRDEQQSLAAQGYAHETRLVAPQDLAQVVDSKCYAGGLIDMGSGHLHPLNLVLGRGSRSRWACDCSNIARHWNSSMATGCRCAAHPGRCAPPTWCWRAMRTWMIWSRA